MSGPYWRVMEAVLSEFDRSRLFEGDDAQFYDSPRLVHHVDEPFRDRLSALYREHIEPGADVLDLMSSWVSHLPADHPLGRVVGHGMNETELAENDALDEWVVQDLNADRTLPFDDSAFDAVLCAISVQYLQYPGEVFAEVGRVLRPGGVCIVSFSNRMFVQKAVRAWRERDMAERAALVESYFEAAGTFEEPTTVSDRPGQDPFVAVLARNQ